MALCHNFTLNGQIKPENMQLLKHALWDTMNMRWLGITLNMNDRRIDLPENRNIPLRDKVKVRALTAHKHVKYNLIVMKYCHTTLKCHPMVLSYIQEHRLNTAFSVA